RWFSGAADRNVDVSYEDLEALIQSRDIQLIDVREPSELIEFGKIPGSVNIPLGQLQSALEMSDRDFKALFSAKKPKMEDENVVFHCMIGGRSLKAVQLAEKLGYN
uniref:Rhodanese domain-containing protein n=1 Tax=Strigamia maritima TaxID=126957 RepID=T1IZR4_STRMM